MIRQISFADFPDALPGLADVLHACVSAGASVNFLLPFSEEEARDFWAAKIGPELERGALTLWAWEEAGRILGTVQLVPAPQPNGPHRAEVSKMLVHPDGRRRGVARSLLVALEDHARRTGRTTLTLDTLSGSPAEALYAGMGFEVAGSIPAFVRATDGPELLATTYMYKLLD